jgi:carbon monoxide dehydrogenase subunit G
MFKPLAVGLLACAAFTTFTSFSARAADDVIRLGNLKLAHFAAISYIKEIAPKCGIKVEESTFAKGLDVMQAIIAGELDVGATASEAAISGRAKGIPIYVVAGFAKGGAVVRLETVPEGTKLSYDVEAQIGGKLAQLGGRLINGVAKKMADEFFANFAKEVGGTPA